MMAGLGFAEILILALLSGGAGSTDLIALIPPQHYFQTKGIEISIPRAVELANTEPKDAKSQVMQLTALRYLFDEADAFKKSPKYGEYRRSLDAIAEGKASQDSLGFARDYARRVLLKLDGKKADSVMLPHIRDEALNWFPAHATLLFTFDFRRAQIAPPGQDPLKDVLKLVPNDVKKELYKHIERSGNVRMDRFAAAMSENAANREQNRIYLRFTGKANPAWAADALKALNPQFEVKQRQNEQDAPIILLQNPDRAPILAMIGNTELVVVGYDGEKQKHLELLNEVLAVRDKKQPNATAGVFKDRLKKIPDKAVAMLLTDLTKDLKQAFQFVAKAQPNRIVAHVERVPQGLDLHLESNMANMEDTGKLVQKIGDLRKEGIVAIQQAMQQPPQPGTPMIPFQTLINVMESLQVQGDGNRVHVRLLLPDGLLQQLGSMGMMFGDMGQRAAPPPPAKMN